MLNLSLPSKRWFKWCWIHFYQQEHASNTTSTRFFEIFLTQIPANLTCPDNSDSLLLYVELIVELMLVVAGPFPISRVQIVYFRRKIFNSWGYPLFKAKACNPMQWVIWKKQQRVSDREEATKNSWNLRNWETLAANWASFIFSTTESTHIIFQVLAINLGLFMLFSQVVMKN